VKKAFTVEYIGSFYVEWTGLSVGFESQLKLNLSWAFVVYWVSLIGLVF